VVIIAQKIINEFASKHPLSADALNRWYKEVRDSDWQNFADVKRTVNSTDAVGNDRYVFDIGGNKYRLIAMIHFKHRTLYIRFIGTHGQYDELNKKGLTATI